MKMGSFHRWVLVLSNSEPEEDSFACSQAAHRGEQGFRSRKGRIPFPWPCHLIKRWIYIQLPLLTLSGLSFPSLAGTGTDANFCTDKDLSWHCRWHFFNKFDTRHQKYLSWGETALRPTNTARSLLKLSQLPPRCNFFCSNNTSLQGEIQQARSACGALSAGNGTQESVSAFLCL